MAFRWRWLLILSALILSGGQLFAAGAKEQSAYAAAVAAFQDEMWGRAETEFAQFRQKYPKSANVPEAVLLQAQAEFKQGELAQAIALLADTNHLAKAGTLTDQYVYWIGEAQFQNVDLAAAAETFISLSRDFPESTLRLRAVVEAAAARAELGRWPQVVALLQETNGVFQRAVEQDPASELVTRGRLMLAQAAFAQEDFGGAAATLASVNPQTLEPNLDWQLANLVYQVKLAMGDTNAALAATTNLLEIARLGNDESLRGESVALHAGLLEQTGLKAEALEAYQENLTNAPVERQRQAILKITELAVAQGRFSTAEDSLRDFITRFTNSPAADIALLSLGELHLKDYAASRTAGSSTNHLGEATNHLLKAQARFDQLTNGPLAGKAYLDRGWCLWLLGKIPESYDSFKSATEKLPPSKDLAVARFKLGDALFAQTNYTGALENYRAVVDDFSQFPAVMQSLGSRALYQSLRACMALTNTAGAEDTMGRILKLYPASEETGNNLLLMGEYLADLGQPTNALDVFQQFELIFPHSPVQPRVELAIAHACEQEQDWPTAIGIYEKWLADYPTNALRPQADYALARANYQAGNETNAFILFTNFVARYLTNGLAPDLAPLAQWWLADHFYRAGDYYHAEYNYKLLFQTWPASDLACQARMMAGQMAVARGSLSDAIQYFTALITSLTTNTNRPPEQYAEALFAYGGALMLKPPDDLTNNPLANFQLATNVFSQICQLYPANELGAQAWCEIGKCDLQLTNYDAAMDAYAQVFDNTNVPATISTRSQAQIAFGVALEKKAGLASGTNQAALLQLALDNYLDVFDTSFGKNLRAGETADPFWVEKAGLQALPLIQSLGVAPPERFIDQMEILLPQLKDLLEKKRAALPPAKS
jgi:TolA-binding protein